MTRTSRVSADVLFDRARQIGDRAKVSIDAEVEAARKKTARLRAERQAKQEAEGRAEIGKDKPVPKKASTKRPNKSS